MSAIRRVPSWRPASAVANDGPKKPGAWKAPPGTTAAAFVPGATVPKRSFERQGDTSRNA
jgi:hypothetical protein